jgi:hypothetical protein
LRAAARYRGWLRVLKLAPLHARVNTRAIATICAGVGDEFEIVSAAIEATALLQAFSSGI